MTLAIEINKESSATLSPISTTFGMEVSGSDLQALATQNMGYLREALIKHKLLVFRDQDTSPENLTFIAKKIGELLPYPFSNGIDSHPYITEIRKEPTFKKVFSGQWHVDSSYLTNPPDYTLLAAIETPLIGGDTVFSDTQKAFSELSLPLQHFLLSVDAEYKSNEYYDAKHLLNFNDAQNECGVLEAIHKAIYKHDDTDIPSLYVNEEHTRKFVGMSESESKPILKYLFDHITRDEFTTRVKWEPNTIALWDNRGLQHHAVNDYYGKLRVMHRIIIKEKSMSGVRTYD